MDFSIEGFLDFIDSLNLTEKFQDKGKEHFPKISVVATEATKPAAVRSGKNGFDFSSWI